MRLFIVPVLFTFQPLSFHIFFHRLRMLILYISAGIFVVGGGLVSVMQLNTRGRR
jgi:hypothetical protein